MTITDDRATGRPTFGNLQLKVCRQTAELPLGVDHAQTRTGELWASHALLVQSGSDRSPGCDTNVQPIAGQNGILGDHSPEVAFWEIRNDKRARVRRTMSAVAINHSPTGTSD
jgi:hypothetical protein